MQLYEQDKREHFLNILEYLSTSFSFSDTDLYCDDSYGNITELSEDLILLYYKQKEGG